MTAEPEFLRDLWKDQQEQSRLMENQRATLSNIVLVIYGAGLGLIAKDGFTRGFLVITIPMILLGVYGIVASLKYFERITMHYSRCRSIHEKLTSFDDRLDVEEEWRELRENHKREFLLSSRVQIYYLWVALHSVVLISGIVLTVVGLLVV